MRLLLFLIISHINIQNVKSQDYDFDEFIDNWHIAAAKADEVTFFGMMDENAIYI